MYNAAGQIDKDQLIQRFAPLVKRIAYHLMARLPSSVQVDDLIQNGMMGLLDAINRFEAGMGAQFETYAAQRVRGAMLDGLRENDWLPRSLRRDFRRIEVAISQLEQEYGRTPSESELAETLGMALAEYQKMLQDARGHQLISFEDMIDDGNEDFLERHLSDDSNEPSRILEDESLRKSLVQGNLREIGEVMGVTESRVCQLHSQAVARLRARIFGDTGLRKKAKKNG